MGDIEFPVRISNFGREKGTIILDMADHEDLSKITGESGYYCSCLNTEVYSEYDREVFVDTLEDWGYFGSIRDRPAWYKGKFNV